MLSTATIVVAVSALVFHFLPLVHPVFAVVFVPATLMWFLSFGFPVSMALGVAMTLPFGKLLWSRYGTETNTPRHGAVLGALTMVCSIFVASTVGVTIDIFVHEYPGMTLLETIGFFFGSLLTQWTVLGALLLVGWLLIPAGAVGGWYYERARQPDRDDVYAHQRS